MWKKKYVSHDNVDIYLICMLYVHIGKVNNCIVAIVCAVEILRCEIEIIKKNIINYFVRHRTEKQIFFFESNGLWREKTRCMNFCVSILSLFYLRTKKV